MPVRIGGTTTPQVLPDPIIKPGTTTPVKPGVIDVRPPKYVAPKANITLPPNLGRPPRAADLIITKAFDGKTVPQAVDKITSMLTTKVAPENKALVASTAKDRVRDFNVALNNVFTPNTPNNAFLKSLGTVQLTVLSQMSTLTPVAYKAVNPQDGSTKYYARDWSGNFAEMPRPPTNVVMEARVRLEPPGLVMSYPKWANKSLSGPLCTITEL